jgi:hypothetical protein
MADRWKGVAAVALLASAIGGAAGAAEPTPPGPEPVLEGPARAATLRAGRPPRGSGHRDETPPDLTRHPIAVPTAERTFYVRRGADPGGDGSIEKPWRDAQEALCLLAPGDRLVFTPATYRPPLIVGEACKDGTAERPIQLFFAVDAVISGDSQEPLLEVRRAHWFVSSVEIVPGRGRGAAFATAGPGAHDVVLVDAHLHGGLGAAIAIEPGSARVTIANNHIHHFGHPKRAPDADGIVIAPGTKQIRVVANQIHHVRGEPIAVVAPANRPPGPDGKPLPAADVLLRGNQIGETFAADD